MNISDNGVGQWKDTENKRKGKQTFWILDLYCDSAVQFIYFGITVSCTVHDLELTGAWGYQMRLLSLLGIIMGGLAPSYLSYSILFLESKSQHKTWARFTSEVLLIMTGGMPDPLTLGCLKSHSLSTLSAYGGRGIGYISLQSIFLIALSKIGFSLHEPKE